MKIKTNEWKKNRFPIEEIDLSKKLNGGFNPEPDLIQKTYLDLQKLFRAVKPCRPVNNCLEDLKDESYKRQQSKEHYKIVKNSIDKGKTITKSIRKQAIEIIASYKSLVKRSLKKYPYLNSLRSELKKLKQEHKGKLANV